MICTDDDNKDQESCQMCRNFIYFVIKRIRQELQENKKQGRIARKQESGKNLRIQESCLTSDFLPHQPRFCLQEYHKTFKILFFRQESCIERIAKESCLKIKKIKNLARREARSSTSVAAIEIIQCSNIIDMQLIQICLAKKSNYWIAS